MRFAFFPPPIAALGLFGAALAPALAAQGAIQLRDIVVLPTIAPDDANHATVAVNPNGDIFVAWHCQLAGSSRHQVEGILVRRSNGLTWDAPLPGDVILLGDPSHAVFSVWEECIKPDVVTVGNDFMVTWPRNEPATGWSQLETALVLVPPAGPPILDTQAPGLGWVVDPLVVGGDAGVMPDLAARRGRGAVAAVVYASETYSQSALREYELRAAVIDFGSSPPAITAPVVLAAPIPVDSTNFGPTGGRVLPDMVEGDYGDLIVAYESFELDVHFGKPTHEGHIFVQRFTESGGAFLPLETLVFDGVVLSNWKRRPNLATIDTDSGNSVSVRWMEHGSALFADIDVGGGQVDFQGGPSPGAVAYTSIPFPNLSSRDHTHPVPIHAAALRASFSSRWYAAGTGIVYNSALPARPEILIPATATFPWRPAVDLLEFRPPGTPDGRLVPLTYEGTNPGSWRTEIMLQIFRL